MGWPDRSHQRGVGCAGRTAGVALATFLDYHPSMTETPSPTIPTPAPMQLRQGPGPRAVGVVYGATLPWLVATWVVGAFLPGPAGYQVPLVIGASVFVMAAAARGLGLHPGWSVWALAIDRAFTHLTSLLVLLVMVGFAGAIGATVGAMVAEAVGLRDDRLLSLSLAALVAAPILWWHWPAAALAFVVPEEAGQRGPGGRGWRGPGYGHARRLVRTAGSAPAGALILGLVLIWTTLLVTTAGYRSGVVFPRLVEAASYLVFIPLLVALSAIETRRMVLAWHAAGRRS
jgi:hypothetical protein